MSQIYRVLVLCFVSWSLANLCLGLTLSSNNPTNIYLRLNPDHLRILIILPVWRLWIHANHYWVSSSPRCCRDAFWVIIGNKGPINVNTNSDILRTFEKMCCSNLKTDLFLHLDIFFARLIIMNTENFFLWINYLETSAADSCTSNHPRVGVLNFN